MVPETFLLVACSLILQCHCYGPPSGSVPPPVSDTNVLTHSADNHDYGLVKSLLSSSLATQSSPEATPIASGHYWWQNVQSPFVSECSGNNCSPSVEVHYASDATSKVSTTNGVTGVIYESNPFLNGFFDKKDQLYGGAGSVITSTGYPVITGEYSKPDVVQVTSNSIAPSTSTPYQGPLAGVTPYPGCPAALKCVPETYCTAEGVAADTPVQLTNDFLLTRVPLTDCLDVATGIVGKCCRDPNYKDPWPEDLPHEHAHEHEHTDSNIIPTDVHYKPTPGYPVPSSTENVIPISVFKPSTDAPNLNGDYGGVSNGIVPVPPNNYAPPLPPYQPPSSTYVPPTYPSPPPTKPPYNPPRPPPSTHVPPQSTYYPSTTPPPLTQPPYTPPKPAFVPQQPSFPPTYFPPSYPSYGPSHQPPVISQQPLQPPYITGSQNPITGYPVPSQPPVQQPPQVPSQPPYKPPPPSLPPYKPPSYPSSSPPPPSYPTPPPTTSIPPHSSTVIVPSQPPYLTLPPAKPSYPPITQPPYAPPSSYPSPPPKPSPPPPTQPPYSPSPVPSQPAYPTVPPKPSYPPSTPPPYSPPQQPSYPVSSIPSQPPYSPGPSPPSYPQPPYSPGYPSQPGYPLQPAYPPQYPQQVFYPPGYPPQLQYPSGPQQSGYYPLQPAYPSQSYPQQQPYLAPKIDSSPPTIVKEYSATCGVRKNDGTAFGAAPWHAIVYSSKNKDLICGGAIVSENAVLTTAHCLDHSEAETTEVKIGPDGKVYKVAAIARHSQYDRVSLSRDLALVVLKEPVEFGEYVDKICLPTSFTQLNSYNRDCYVSTLAKEFEPKTLQTIPVQVFTYKDCEVKLRNTYLGKYFVLNDSFSCVSTPAEADLCLVKTGSPIACDKGDGRFELFGIKSWDLGCQEYKKSAIFSNSDVIWLQSTLAAPITKLIADEKSRLKDKFKGDVLEGVNIQEKPGFALGYGK